MAQSKTTRSVTQATATHTVTTQVKIALALTQASSQAKKQLAYQGLKLPTQIFTVSPV